MMRLYMVTTRELLALTPARVHLQNGMDATQAGIQAVAPHQEKDLRHQMDTLTSRLMVRGLQDIQVREVSACKSIYFRF